MQFLFRKIKQDSDLEMILNWRTFLKVVTGRIADFHPFAV